MRNDTSLARIVRSLVLAVGVALVASACVFVPAGPAVEGPVVAAPPVVVVPGPPVYRYHYGGWYYGRRW